MENITLYTIIGLLAIETINVIWVWWKENKKTIEKIHGES